MSGAERCLECGCVTAADGRDCAALRDTLFARDFEQAALYGKHHRLAVDSYCVQHSAYVLSAKSLAAHLCGLCIALEHDGDEEMLRQVQRWLSTNPKLEKPMIPEFRGAVTIAAVSELEDSEAYGAAVREWAVSAWSAYRTVQPVAREWLALSASRR